MSLAEDHNATITVTGMHGRKGIKADPTIMGTTVTHLAKNCTNPVVIVKDSRPRSIKTDSKYRFGVCYDGSNSCNRALRTVLSMMRPDDKLVIITVKESDIKTEMIESSVNSVCAECNINTQTFELLDRDSRFPAGYNANVYKTI